jgi:hypothetical protein
MNVALGWVDGPVYLGIIAAGCLATCGLIWLARHIVAAFRRANTMVENAKRLPGGREFLFDDAQDFDDEPLDPGLMRILDTLREEERATIARYYGTDRVPGQRVNGSGETS